MPSAASHLPFISPYQPYEARIIKRAQEAPTIFTLYLEFTDPRLHRGYNFLPGQFNMLYLYGVGEVPISIVSDPDDASSYGHTIRVVGRVTKGLAALKEGDTLGVRGPYGQGWPLPKILGKNIVIVTGGLGCAPVVSIINYLMRRRDQYGEIAILQGVKHSYDLIFADYYEKWRNTPNTQVLLSANQAGPDWREHVGHVTELFDQLTLNPQHAVAMMCGPEIMMKIAAETLHARHMLEKNMYLNLERNMKCAIGHCGHCQFGPHFICKNGPVIPYPQLKPLFEVVGL